MIKGIQLLRNIGKFQSFAVSTQPEFGKVTLIYGENGRGKTTIANILRSLGNNDPLLINERQRLGSTNTPHIVIKSDSQFHNFQNGSWSSNLSEILVFDDNFIAQNICSGINIQSDHKQNLHELIIGAQGVALDNALKTHIEKIEEHNKKIASITAEIPSNIRGNLTVEKFCSLLENNNVTSEIQETERKLAAASESQIIIQKAEFQKINLPIINIQEIEEVLQKDLNSLQSDTSSLVQNHLNKLGNGAETWVSDGLQKIGLASEDKADGICPFCTQELKNSEIIKYYEVYFSKGYTDLKKEINELENSLTSKHNADAQSNFERAVRLNIESSIFWKKFIDLQDFSVDTEKIASSWKAARNPILAILKNKIASPLEKIPLTSEIYEAVLDYERNRQIIEELNVMLQSINSQIASVKAQSSVLNISTLENDLSKLKMVDLRYSPKYQNLCDEYIIEKNNKRATEALRDNARNSLEQYRVNIFNQYQNAINFYLNKFNAGFELSSVAPQNHRGGSSCNYNVLINTVEVPLTANNGPSFRNTLSAGDRNTLALAFFFSSLDQDPSLNNKIIIIDDPMTSFDEHRTLATIQEIRNLETRTKQIIVLSHSKQFLCQIWDSLNINIRKAFSITRFRFESFISEWDIHQDCITEHDKRHAKVLDFINAANQGDEREVATCLRYILEAFLRVAYPFKFHPGKLLGQFYNECNQAIRSGGPHILNVDDTNELGILISYANKFHHETNQAYMSEVINDQELLAFCNRTMSFAKRA